MYREKGLNGSEVIDGAYYEEQLQTLTAWYLILFLRIISTISTPILSQVPWYSGSVQKYDGQHHNEYNSYMNGKYTVYLSHEDAKDSFDKYRCAIIHGNFSTPESKYGTAKKPIPHQKIFEFNEEKKWNEWLH